MRISILNLLLILVTVADGLAQNDSIKLEQNKLEQQPLKPLKWQLSKDGAEYIQFTGLIQTWLRYNESNPGTNVNGAPESHTFDIGMRRVRFQILGQLSKKIFFYSQVGMNSFSFLSERKYGFFIHDATGEYAFVPKHLTIGTGLGSWVGPLRFSYPAVVGIMGCDAPIFQQTTNDMNDQFVRRFMIYAKGKLGKLDYRVSVAKPFIVNASNAIPIPGSQAAVAKLGDLPVGVSTFSIRDPSPQFNTYMSYQFFDQETNFVPYLHGTYLGTKKVFNIGGGFQYQNKAMWHKEQNATTGEIDTVSTRYLTAGIDLLYDAPINKDKGTAISLYACFLHSDYGTHYVRTFAPMNPADAASTFGNNSFGSGTKYAYTSGGGNAFPINGTGNTYFVQAGYKFRDYLLGKMGTLMPYAMYQHSKYFHFSESVRVWNVGMNWLLKGHNAKFSLDYQNRPFFVQPTPSDVITQEARRGMIVLQYQVAF